MTEPPGKMVTSKAWLVTPCPHHPLVVMWLHPGHKSKAMLPFHRMPADNSPAISLLGLRGPWPKGLTSHFLCLSSLNPHPELGAFQAHLEQVMTSPSPRLALHFPWQEIRWGAH